LFVICILSLVYPIVSYSLVLVKLEAWRLWLVAYLLVVYPTPEKISGSWQRMQQEVDSGPP